jgi:hypothetical protein
MKRALEALLRIGSPKKATKPNRDGEGPSQPAKKAKAAAGGRERGAQRYAPKVDNGRTALQ